MTEAFNLQIIAIVGTGILYYFSRQLVKTNTSNCLFHLALKSVLFLKWRQKQERVEFAQSSEEDKFPTPSWAPREILGLWFAYFEAVRAVPLPATQLSACPLSSRSLMEKPKHHELKRLAQTAIPKLMIFDGRLRHNVGTLQSSCTTPAAQPGSCWRAGQEQLPQGVSSGLWTAEV